MAVLGGPGSQPQYDRSSPTLGCQPDAVGMVWYCRSPLCQGSRQPQLPSLHSLQKGRFSAGEEPLNSANSAAKGVPAGITACSLLALRLTLCSRRSMAGSVPLWHCPFDPPIEGLDVGHPEGHGIVRQPPSLNHVTCTLFLEEGKRRTGRSGKFFLHPFPLQSSPGQTPYSTQPSQHDQFCDSSCKAIGIVFMELTSSVYGRHDVRIRCRLCPATPA